MLTDFDPLAVVDIPDQGLYKSFNRPPLVVTLDVYGQPITVITAHLKVSVHSISVMKRAGELRITMTPCCEYGLSLEAYACVQQRQPHLDYL
nr:hypothetical protein [Psychrobacter sp. PraFG1]UNK04775.1 hypothetical protein MN210_11260 [Psychrobacter sp. PraFG1]